MAFTTIQMSLIQFSDMALALHVKLFFLISIIRQKHERRNEKATGICYKITLFALIRLKLETNLV